MKEDKAFLAFAALMFFSLLSERILFVVFPVYLLSLHFNAEQIGLVFSIAGALLLITRPFIGRLSDTVGRKVVMSFGLVTQAVAVSAYAFANTFLAFSIVKSVEQISDTLNASVDNALLGDTYKKGVRAKVISKLGIWYTYARLITIIIGFITSTYLALSSNFFVAALAALLSLFVVNFMLSEKNKTSASVEKRPPLLKSMLGYSTNFKKMLVVGFLSESAYNFVYVPAFFVLAVNIGMQASTIFLYLFVSYVINSTIFYFLGKRKVNLGTKTVCMLGFVVYGLALASYALASQQLQILVIIPFVTLGFYLYRIGNQRILLDMTKTKTRGEQVGIYQTLVSLSDVVIPAVAGYMITAVSITSVFITGGACAMGAALAIYLIRDGGGARR